ncbi:MAG: glutamate--tRNA ligase [Candidatus Dormibacteraeota bacterium]|uniref:Glutamate--tRNA ligase n=1 Tax=Candidatus Amunia macphersoniae TaxID=3127014 RepID=A0A934KKY9_9BACT|nr:glutamate--tRNA ligase [Candidatus Dormibacteraeota bacterium]
MIDGRTPMRTRFAPSPTGPLHFGSVRTALFAWLAARASGGQFVLRIEDTDQERYLEDSEALIMETLLWLGLTWDEGPEVGGSHGPYVQSQRTAIYREHAERLVTGGAAYWCTCSPERLTEMRERQRAASEPTRYDRHCLAIQDEVRRQRDELVPAVLRQRIEPGRTRWDDVVRGEISFDNADIDDQVLLKSDGFPTYHLAVVVDDHLMDITDVIRSDEWIPSTPKHLGLYQAFGWAPPRFAHVPPVLGEDRLKLSKRRGARNVLEYGELGYLAAAIVNAMALLGWSSGTEQELFTPAELVERFSLDRVHDSAAVFDPKRLDSLNGQHIRRLSVEELVEQLEFWLLGTSKETRRRLVPLLQERMVVMRDATSLAAPLLGDAPWDDDVVFPPRKVDGDTAIALLDTACAEVESGGLDDLTAMRERLTALLDSHGVKARDGFRVLYIAILGRAQGVPVFDAMAFIGVEVSVRRLRAARARLEL